MDRREAARLVGRKVAVRLNSVEAQGVEIIATLDEVRDDGVVLSEVGELRPGPTMFCPWGNLHRLRKRPPWLAPPHEEPGPQEWEPYAIREVHTDEAEPEPSVERRRGPSAINLERVVPVAQRQTVGNITVALTALELYGEGLGLLRWRITLGRDALRRDPDLGFGVPEPEFEIRDDSGRELPWSSQGSGSGGGEADGGIEVMDLPDAGVLEVEVSRLVADAYGQDGVHLGQGMSHEGPWTFQFAI